MSQQISYLFLLSTGAAGESLLNDVAADILRRLPPDFDLEKSLEKFPVRYEESMNTVLTQELERFNK